jgi:8-oxo-dGTP diphosphatase
MYIPKIFVTVDNVIVRTLDSEKELLLIKRKNNPFKDFWALPGGFVDENEDLEDAARRELQEETNINVSEIHQVGAYGKPGRDPRSHVVSIAYFAEVANNLEAKAQDDAKEVNWFNIKKLPNLAFDHENIINDTIKKFL